jgi:hypothetical protein
MGGDMSDINAIISTPTRSERNSKKREINGDNMRDTARKRATLLSKRQIRSYQKRPKVTDDLINGAE